MHPMYTNARETRKLTYIYFDDLFDEHTSMTMRIICRRYAREIINIASNSDNVFIANYLRRYN